MSNNSCKLLQLCLKVFNASSPKKWINILFTLCFKLGNLPEKIGLLKPLQSIGSQMHPSHIKIILKEWTLHQHIALRSQLANKVKQALISSKAHKSLTKAGEEEFNKKSLHKDSRSKKSIWLETMNNQQVSASHTKRTINLKQKEAQSFRN